jgi:hypothetical protein
VCQKLLILSRYARNWTSGPFVSEELGGNVSPESSSTMNKFGQARIFADRAGRNFDCRWHARLTPGSWRLHFSPDGMFHRIVVCYVGEGLPTNTDPT